MMLLVGLIFVVVGFNVYHSLRRSVYERMEEIAVLKAMGIPPRRIQAIFVLEGLFIGLVGGGSAPARPSAGGERERRLLGSGGGGQRGHAPGPLPAGPVRRRGERRVFSIFSPGYFYLTHVPSHVFLARGVPRLLLRGLCVRGRRLGSLTRRFPIPPRGGAAL